MSRGKGGRESGLSGPHSLLQVSRASWGPPRGTGAPLTRAHPPLLVPWLSQDGVFLGIPPALGTTHGQSRSLVSNQEPL